MSQKSKLMQWIDYRVRVTTQEGRMFVGTFLAFDKHLNVVLSDTEEYRKIRAKKRNPGDPVEREEKRILGMIILRGVNIVSFTAEEPPIVYDRKADKAAAGPGKAQAISRQGAPVSQGAGGPGLSAVPKGLGQPAPQAMIPQQSRAPTMLPPAPMARPPGVPPPQ